MTIDTSVGVSNTAGYSYTGGDPTLTNIPGIGNDISVYKSTKPKEGFLFYRGIECFFHVVLDVKLF